MEGGVCSFLGVCYSQWLHEYDFSYPRVWGGCLFPFSEFGLFPMATRVRFFVPASMGRVLVLFWGCRLPNGFTGTIFRTREYERWFVSFWGCRLLNGFTGTIFRTRKYGEGACFLFFWGVVCLMAS